MDRVPLNMPTWIAVEPSQAGICAICCETAVSGVADEEFGRVICPECVDDVMFADVVLRIPGYCRPARRGADGRQRD